MMIVLLTLKVTLSRLVDKRAPLNHMIMPVEYTETTSAHSSEGITQPTFTEKHLSHTTPLTDHMSTEIHLLIICTRLRRPGRVKRDGKALLEELVISTDSVS